MLSVRDSTIREFLDALADRVPVPGGGASAGLHAAQAAALVAMVARYTTGPRYAEHADAVAAIRDSADRLREESLDLAEDDMAAFAAVGEAYRVPKEDATRSATIEAAVLGAARAPERLVRVVGQVIELAETLGPIANRNVISDVAAAAEAARAAATTARVNIEINLAGISEATARAELRSTIDAVDGLVERAELLTSTVRKGLAG